MIILLSPAKNLNFKEIPKLNKGSVPKDLKESGKIIEILRKKSPGQIKKMMRLSDQLAAMNFERFQNWSESPEKGERAPAVFVFAGDVYRGLDARNLGGHALNRANKSIRILSGLHGMLRPFDLIMPYRLEMGTKLKIGSSKNLYEFWKKSVTDRLILDLEKNKSNVIINLASKEYFSVVDFSRIDAKIITPHFKEYRGGVLKSIQFNLKRARGLLAKYAVEENVKSLKQLKAFNYEGYRFSAELSKGDDWMFVREITL